MLELKKAQRSKAYLKLGMSAPSGGGKTLGALLIAYGLMKEKYPNKPDDFLWGKIAIVDTENGSGELYVGSEHQNVKIGEYNAVTLQPPFSVDKYIQALNLCEEADMEVCILDSTTHAWTGEGGLLEQQGNIAKRIGNSYAAWREITPQHNTFVSKMLQTPMHIIATMRSKQEYVQEKDDRGKTTIRKVGLEPEQRKGMEYEFTAFIEVNVDHEAYGSKDRTSIYDQQTFVITPDVGRKYMRWLQSDVVEKEPEVIATAHKANPKESIQNVKDDVVRLLNELGGSSNETLVSIVKQYAPNGNPNSISSMTEISNLRSELIDLQEQETK